MPTPRSIATSFIVRAAPRAVILVVTDPPDPLADTARTRAGHDRGFRFHLAEHFDVDANQVEAQVIGQHGVSQVFLWSVARIAGVPIGKLIEARGKSLEGMRKKNRRQRSRREHHDHQGNDASQLGIRSSR
jgi:L-lactate dehydrogenase